MSQAHGGVQSYDAGGSFERVRGAHQGLNLLRILPGLCFDQPFFESP
jgi:hypothetical protein